jgi:hypothetical protein
VAEESLQEETAVFEQSLALENNGGNSFLTVADDLEALESTAFLEAEE